MGSCKNQVIIRCFLLWCSCIDYYHRVQQSIRNLFYYLQDYYYGYHDMWAFASDHSIPVTMNNIHNINHISWIYNNSTTMLEESLNDATKIHYKLSWLSAKIITYHPTQEEQLEYDIDPFLSTFLVKTSSDSPPSLHNIFYAWCAYKKYWFHPDSTIEFHVIDEMGEDYCFELEHNCRVKLQADKIYVSKNM